MPTLTDPLQSVKGRERRKRRRKKRRRKKKRKKKKKKKKKKKEKKKKESQRHKLCHGRLTRRTDAQHYANSLSGAPENMLVTDDSSKIAFVTDGAWNAVMLDGRDA